ncbi:MAG TPA: extracellular solute-binding protein [Actinomycetales bacterium]|nr:extracellular solute-binding protein [Actinomycetales bacterium]
MRSKNLRVGALIVGISALVASCAQGSSITPEEMGDPEDFSADESLSGSLEIMGFGVGDEIAEVRYNRADEALDGVTLNLVEGELDIQQFLTAVASGDAPGLINANRDQIGMFASRGAVIPLDSCIEGEEIDTDVFREPALDQVTFAGSVYGIPEFNSIQMTMANADLLSEAGLSIEDVNGTDWNAITNATEEMYRKSGGDLEVIGFDSKLPEFLPLWAKVNGVSLLSDDARTVVLDAPEVVEALEFANNIYEIQGGFSAVKAYRDSADFFGEGNQFATDVLGGMPMEQWYVNVLNDVSEDASMAFDAFRGFDGEPIAYATGSAWAIPADTESEAAACRFMKLMTETDAWMEAAQERADQREESGQLFTGLLTANVEADDAIREKFITDDAPAPWGDAINAMYEANDHTFSFPANPADAQFTTAWQDAVNRVLNGEMEAQESLEKGQEEAQEALDEAWAKWDEKQ